MSSAGAKILTGGVFPLLVPRGRNEQGWFGGEIVRSPLTPSPAPYPISVQYQAGLGLR